MAAREAEAIPLPKEDTTPPVIKINLVIMARFDRFGDPNLKRNNKLPDGSILLNNLAAKFNPIGVYQAPAPTPPPAAAPDTAHTPINPRPPPILRLHIVTGCARVARAASRAPEVTFLTYGDARAPANGSFPRPGAAAPATAARRLCPGTGPCRPRRRRGDDNRWQAMATRRINSRQYPSQESRIVQAWHTAHRGNDEFQRPAIGSRHGGFSASGIIA